jgi:VanZ family protein
VKESLKRWWPIGLYCLLITGLSSIPAKDLPPEPSFGFEIPFLDKIVHLCLYGGFGLVLTCVLKRPQQALIAVALYGAFDENYQRLTPGRSCDLYDWVADMIGGSLGILVFLLYDKYIARRKTS